MLTVGSVFDGVEMELKVDAIFSWVIFEGKYTGLIKQRKLYELDVWFDRAAIAALVFSNIAMTHRNNNFLLVSNFI